VSQPVRTPEAIRREVEAAREDLRKSLDQLHVKIEYLTDWRTQIVNNRTRVLVAAGAAGFVLGGGIAGVLGLFRRS
jgi:hypothetical protein